MYFIPIVQRISRFVLFFFLGSILVLGCSKEQEKNLPRPEYFQCKINGMDFLPVRAFQCEAIRGIYHDGPVNDLVANEFYSSTGYNCENRIGVNIQVHNLVKGSNEVFELGDSVHGITAKYYNLDVDIFEKTLYVAISGNFKFTKVVKPYTSNGTPIPGYLVGTFEFVAVNSYLNDTVVVTNGKFDVTVPN